MVRHATVQAIWLSWTGWNWHDDNISWSGVPIQARACDPETYDGEALAFDEFSAQIPTCPRCAVLYDEAMTAREELLGRKEAA